jgi:hypothetical protein
LNYGEFLPCFAAGETYNLVRWLGRYLYPEEVQAVLTLTYNRAIRPLAMHPITSRYRA